MALSPPLVYKAIGSSSSSPIDPLSVESHHFFTIFFLAKTTEMQVRERITVQSIEKW
jgi:hypothetical protein